MKIIEQVESQLEPGSLSPREIGEKLDLYAVSSQVHDLLETYDLELGEDLGESLDRLLEPVNEDNQYKGHFMDKQELARHFHQRYTKPGFTQEYC